MNTSESPSVAAPGDVFAFTLERIGRYGACQVVAVDETRDLATAAVLAWTGTEVPDVTTLAGVPRMVRDFMFWTPEEMLRNVPLTVPASYLRIGSLPVIGETVSRAYFSWEFDRDVERQYRWNSIPSEARTAFRAALNGEEVATTPGLTCSRSGERYEARLAHARRFSDDAGYLIGDDFRLESLRAWPTLYQVELHAWRDDLLPFLESSPLVKELNLTGHGQRELDFSGTNLDQLTIDITGLHRLVLPQSLDHLILRGDGAVNSFDSLDSLDSLVDELSAAEPAAEPMLQVVAEQDGRWITVNLTGTVPPVRGLERAHGLRISAIEELEIGDIVEHFPGVSWLHLFGAPGLLDELDELRGLSQLTTLWICDLFGYDSSDFPGPDELPSLTSLDLDSIPADAATGVRAQYRKVPRVALTVRKPRKPEWLAENLENPLRHWDGRDGIPGAVSKKARTAFVAALRQVRDTSGAAEPAHTEAVTTAVTEFLDTIAALNRKHQFLYTLERDEVIDAVNALTESLSPEANRALEPHIEEALDD
ncbi:hypothetical protein ABIC28_002732 [Rhodococcus sp. PvR044]|uniref:hypothetical protein n=1 Tax=unclassified Rhodococcus (in: high G+C Gram-positive bacteria) TaxID=192944 RepID=UPI000BDD0319|nr:MULTISPECIES: hypothetical protein [unclassified Rhodococcus (in: high G+C Gram-positive bacteria)]PTR43258.1 hypothetical protein C8K38_108129 [Rhodococcus sp. OK611]SNX91121.1 hypothetical protein SAMN05447004_108127 [Rhodococcus sp. OK270]